LDKSPAGLITDIDGTIALITSTPDETSISSLCRDSLKALTSNMALVAVLTGRGSLKARDMLDIDGVVYVGNHGLERWLDCKLEVKEEAQEYAQAIHDLLDRLRREMDVPGLVMEDKGVSASIHYRLSPEPSMAREAIMDTLGHIPEANGLLITDGKLVVEARPPLGITKGTALRQLVMEYGLKGVLCLGDDVTDVDAFKALHDLTAEGFCDGLAVGILGQNTPPDIEKEADLFLESVTETEELLHMIAETYRG
jgi:trehalose 6-phosphate phosphatase